MRARHTASGALDGEGPGAARAIRKAIDAGTPVALASAFDPHSHSSFNMQYLLHVAVNYLGFTIEEALAAITWNAACSLRLSHVAGSIAPGRPADILIMDVPDYRELPRHPGHHDASVILRAGDVIWRRSRLSGKPLNGN